MLPELSSGFRVMEVEMLLDMCKVHKSSVYLPY